MNIKINKFNNEELEEIYRILEVISSNMFTSPNVGINKKELYFLSGESITAAANTICSIDFCCAKGFFSDAFTLARKLRDDIIQYIFIADIINKVYEVSVKNNNLYFDNEIFEVDAIYNAIIEEIQRLSDEGKKDKSVIAAELWFQGNLDKNGNHDIKTKYFYTSKYISNLKKDTDIHTLFELFLNPLWKTTDKKLNNYVHVNGREYIMDNYPSVGKYERRKKNFVIVVRNIISIFLSILILIEPDKIRASDYMNYMDINVEPPEDSQYWVAPIIVNYMDKYFNDINEELLSFLNRTNKYGMKLLLKDYDEG